MAKIYKRGPCYYLDWTNGDRRYRTSLGRISREEAKAIQGQKEAELSGLITITRGVTVQSLIEEYMRWFEHARPSSFRSARSDMGKFTDAFGPMAAEGLAPHQVEQWEVTHRARGSAHKALKLAKAAFRRAMRSKLIRSNPLDLVQTSEPPIGRAPSFYRAEHIKALSGLAHGAMWRFMVNTGIRRGEMAKAVRSDVRDGMLYVESLATGRTKSGKWRVIPLNRDALVALKKLGVDKLVDAHPDTLSDWFREEAKSASLPGSLHWLRHTFCTALVQSGVSLYDVKVLAGHSSISVTEKYAHHAPGHGMEAVKKLSLWHTSRHSKTGKPKRPRSSVG